MGHGAWGAEAKRQYESRAREQKANERSETSEAKSEKHFIRLLGRAAPSQFPVPSCPVAQSSSSPTPPSQFHFVNSCLFFHFVFYFFSFRFISCCCVSEKHFSQASKKKKNTNLHNSNSAAQYGEHPFLSLSLSLTLSLPCR